jgi:hypothetical protein
MPPKKKGDAKDDLGFMRAARFGRVKNTLSMGFGTSSVLCVCVYVCERKREKDATFEHMEW